MNQDQIEGKWKIFTGNVQEHWGKFTESLSGISKKPKEQVGAIVARPSNEVRDDVDAALRD